MSSEIDFDAQWLRDWLVPGGERLTAEEVAERSGTDGEDLRAFWRALGFADPGPGDRIYTADDVEAARMMRELFAEGVTPGMAVSLGRVLGVAMGQVTSAARELLAAEFSDHENAAERFAAAAAAIAPKMDATLGYVYRLKLREQLRRDAMAIDTSAGSTAEIAVCFADLVGFTSLGEGVPISDLGRVTGRLSELASELVAAPVRIVKLLGDAVMMVSEDPRALLDTALALVDAADQEPDGFPALRAGLAHGEALAQGGDWFGHPVNLASRLSGRARPASVLVDEAIKNAVGERAYSWSFAGSKSLKGVAAPVTTFRVRPAGPNET